MTIFNDVLTAFGIYERSKTYIVDSNIEDMAAEIRKIISDPKPYNNIYKLPPLLEKFREATTKLIIQKREPVFAAIEDAKQRVFEELNNDKLCKDKLVDKFARLFQELKEKAKHSSDIAAMIATKTEADALKVRCLNEINETEARMIAAVTPAPPAQPGKETAPTPVQAAPKPVKKRKSVSIKTINSASTWQIETEDDVDKYVTELKKRLIATLEENTVIDIEF